MLGGVGIEAVEFLAQRGQGLRPVLALPLGLRPVAADKVAPVPCPVAHHFLDLQLVVHRMEATRSRQDRLLPLRELAHGHGQDIVSHPLGQLLAVSRRVHAGGAHADRLAQPPAPQALLALGHRGGIDGVARDHPGAHRQAVAGQGQAHDDLRLVVAPLLAVAPLPQGRPRGAAPRLVALILRVDLEGERGGVPEDEIDLGAEEVGRPEEDLARDGVDMGVQAVQGAVHLLEGQPLGLGQVPPLGDPVFVAGQPGERLGQPIGHPREERQLMGGAPGSGALQAAQHLTDAQFFPQCPGILLPMKA